MKFLYELAEVSANSDKNFIEHCMGSMGFDPIHIHFKTSSHTNKCLAATRADKRQGSRQKRRQQITDKTAQDTTRQHIPCSGDRGGVSGL